MPADKKDYSDYIKHLSNVISVLSLLSGFMFTAYTILITRLPDPSTITAQLTLYVLSTYLSIFLICSVYSVGIVFYCCRSVPPLSEGMTIVNSVVFASIGSSMPVAVVMMSLLWNLTYLALIQTVQGILLAVVPFFRMIRLFWQYRKSISSE